MKRTTLSQHASLRASFSVSARILLLSLVISLALSIALLTVLPPATSQAAALDCADDADTLSATPATLSVQAASARGYVWPLRIPAQVVQGFSSNHGGIDIAIGEGNDVIASMGGTVKYVHRFEGITPPGQGDMDAFGNLVILYHPNGTATYYAHMKDIMVAPGEHVSQGQVVGHVGLTGDTIGYHLHFEVRTDATPVNNLTGMGTRQNPLDYVGQQDLYDGSPVGSNPFGYLDSAVASSDNGVHEVTVSGWALDWDDPDAALEIHVYIGGPAGQGEGHGGIYTNELRSDVNAVFGCSGNHGFAATIPTSMSGQVDVYAYAINIGDGTANPQLGSALSVTLNGPTDHQEGPADDGDDGDNGGGQGEGLPSIELRRLHNPSTGEHLYSSDTDEYDALISQGWEGEGILCRMPDKTAPIATDPMFRLYNPLTGEHHYTSDANEYRVLRATGEWNGEGELCETVADPAYQKVALFRLFNPARAPFAHLLSTDSDEVSTLVSEGWTNEGVACYAL